MHVSLELAANYFDPPAEILDIQDDADIHEIGHVKTFIFHDPKDEFLVYAGRPGECQGVHLRVEIQVREDRVLDEDVRRFGRGLGNVVVDVTWSNVGISLLEICRPIDNHALAEPAGGESGGEDCDFPSTVGPIKDIVAVSVRILGIGATFSLLKSLIRLIYFRYGLRFYGYQGFIVVRQEILEDAVSYDELRRVISHRRILVKRVQVEESHSPFVIDPIRA